MKLVTLAFRNIKRNFTKYVMYFFSLGFSVFTAYSFIALMRNRIIKNAYTYDDRYEAMLQSFGIIIMVFVMFFLLSSNKSFIRARKKEISMYALFGMKNGKIGRLLFMETLTVGVAALAVGIGSGIFFSKLTAMILLDMTLASFTGNISFTIVPEAIYITAIIFMLIFCLMGLSGLRVINKFQLVDLFKAEKMSEGRSRGSLVLLALSVLLTGVGYYLAGSPSPYTVVRCSIPILLLVIIGTYIFFHSGLPRLLHILKRNRGSYYKAANLISLSALSHRMRSIASVMATIAVLSAVATTAVSVGYTLYRNIEKNSFDAVGYDMYFYGGQEKYMDEIDRIFEKHGVEITEQYTTNRYVCSPKTSPFELNGVKYSYDDGDYFRVFSQSAYNRLISISRCDNEPVEIRAGKAMYVCSILNDAIAREVTGRELAFTDKSITITLVLRTGMVSFGALHTLVLNDNDYNLLQQSGDIMSRYPDGVVCDDVTVYRYEDPLGTPELNEDLKQLLMGGANNYKSVYNNYNESMETFGLVCFIGFFMSAVFILMTASLLYFKQVMSAEEEKQQYRTLRKIGMSDPVEKRVITKRLLPVFLIPLLMGITHSIFAMKSADTMVFSNIIPIENSYPVVLACSAVMYGAYALVYGIFFLITRGQYSRIVK